MKFHDNLLFVFSRIQQLSGLRSIPTSVYTQCLQNETEKIGLSFNDKASQEHFSLLDRENEETLDSILVANSLQTPASSEQASRIDRVGLQNFPAVYTTTPGIGPRTVERAPMILENADPMNEREPPLMLTHSC